MKLSVKKTLSCGIPFLSIMLLWQAYNWMVPIYLDDLFKEVIPVGEMIIGIIMALDNLFALFMIPLVASLSDKCKSKIGRRKPYIIVGIILSATFFMIIPYVNKVQNIWLLIANILCILISMNIYRAPAVALMPDITPEPQRSRANSIINIMGAVGTATGYLLIVLFAKKDENVIFLATGLIMFICLLYTIFCLNENRFVEEHHIEEEEYKKQLELEEKPKKVKQQKIQKQNRIQKKLRKRNILLILLAILLFFMSTNAVETFMSLYSKSVFGEIDLPLGLEPGALSMIPFGIGCFAFAYPAALFAEKYGRKLITFIGTIIVSIAYLGISIVSFKVGFSFFILPLFLIGGCGFALVVINILPMVLENSNENNTGKYTGYYYTSSMIAQSITPALCGLFMSSLVFGKMIYLFPYAIVFMLLSGLVILFIKTPKINKKKKLKQS